MVQTYVNWIFLLSFMLIAEAQDPKVLTSIGEIIGRKVNKPLEEIKKLQKEVIYREVHEYLGVPFAQPPTGDLRFKKPVELKSLKSPFYAQNHGAVCPQNAVIFNISSRETSEDCLFLNIYIPVRPADRPSGNAVMIWIHGGGFTEGAGRVL
ncbi:para-nitrobenzyl esterase-like [Ruditapes philippinarum]|uniref:para-nitrobenzyl esterase-like n=1 Tax=Ruditapes philippinarum TaxID=129788 RepID=UPI00295B8854|nr:para-nitrobenzyl esterase-like [Ruditapes philippinarum]